MSRKSAIANFPRRVLDIIEYLLTIAIAAGILIIGWFVDKEVFQNNPLLWSAVVSILMLMAIGNFRDRRHRFHDSITKLHGKLDAKVFDSIRAENFLKADDPSLSFLDDANEICISGITLVRTIGKYHEALFNKVIQGAKVRVILLDSSSKEAISQLELRSWGTVSKNYYENRLASTSDQIEVIGENIKTSPNASGSLEVGVLPFVPSFGMIITNPQDISSGKAWIQIYHHCTDDPSPGFIVDRARDLKWFDFFHEQFEKMWALCRVKKIV